MSIASEISRLQTAKTDIKTAIEAKGVTIPSSATIDTYDDYVSQISGGGGGGDTTTLAKLIDRSITSIDVPSGTTSIGTGVFKNCSSLTSITIPDSVTSIDDEGFRDCISLPSITIPTGVTYIGNQAFYRCVNFTNITIPNSVTYIGNQAFYNCVSLTSITINTTTPPTLGNANAFNNTNNCPIYVPSASVDTYKAADKWSSLSSRIQAIPNS